MLFTKIEIQKSFVTFTGIYSLISLAVLSYERYCTMVSPTIASGRDYRPALVGICFSCLYSLGWTVPPLVGWSRYGPEGPGTTCSVDWRSQSANNVSYIVCLFTFCLLLPFCTILYSYGKLLCAIRQASSVAQKKKKSLTQSDGQKANIDLLSIQKHPFC